MNKAFKASLLSALVFPGAGHFLLKKPIQGAILAAVALACLYQLLTFAMAIADQVSLKLQTGELPLDITTLNDFVGRQLAGNSGEITSMLPAVLGITWVIAVVDSFRLGRKLDQQKQSDAPL